MRTEGKYLKKKKILLKERKTQKKSHWLAYSDMFISKVFWHPSLFLKCSALLKRQLNIVTNKIFKKMTSYNRWTVNTRIITG